MDALLRSPLLIKQKPQKCFLSHFAVFLMESRGVEPLSERPATKLSTYVDHVLI